MGTQNLVSVRPESSIFSQICRSFTSPSRQQRAEALVSGESSTWLVALPELIVKIWNEYIDAPLCEPLMLEQTREKANPRGSVVPGEWP